MKTKADFMKSLPWSNNWKWYDATGVKQMPCRRVARIELVTRGNADDYVAVELTILNKDEGQIERKYFHFDDYLTARADLRRDYAGTFKCWRGGAGNDWDWYIAVPTKVELKKFVIAVEEYVEELS